MMASVVLDCAGASGISKTHPNTNYYFQSSFVFFVDPFSELADYVCFEFDAPTTYKYNKILSGKANVYVKGTSTVSTWYPYFAGWGFKQRVNTREVTFNNKPEYDYAANLVFSEDWAGSTEEGWETVALTAKQSIIVLRNGMAVNPSFKSKYDTSEIFGFFNEKAPFLEITVSNELASVIASNMSPNGARVDRFSTVLFSWSAESADLSMVAPIQESAEIQWRIRGETAYHSVAIQGDSGSYAFPPETFPLGSMEWRVLITASSGVETESAWTPFETADSISIAKIVSPKSISIDASVVNRFSWEHIISSGSLQSAADLQQSEDASTWTQFATVSGSNQYYDVPADTFSSGNHFWRVRTYNGDNVAGSWSDPKEFVAIAAPATPAIVILSMSPRPLISWQGSDQQAYELKIEDIYSSGVVYGTTPRLKIPVYLSDGTYTVNVRIQNSYGLWSGWASAVLPVTNTPGEDIALSVEAGNVADLRWRTEGSYDLFLVIRDGFVIGRTQEPSYTDKTANGSVTYQIRGCYADSDNYGLSNEVTADLTVQTLTIIDLSEGGIALELRLSDSQYRTVSVSRSREVAMISLMGAEYPVAEASKHRVMVISSTCAFPNSDTASIAAFEAMIGKLVCLKTKTGDAVTGILQELGKATNQFYSVFTVQVQQIAADPEVIADA